MVDELGGGHQRVVQGQISRVGDDDVPGAEVAGDDGAFVLTRTRGGIADGGAVDDILVTVATQVVHVVETAAVIGPVDEVHVAVGSGAGIEDGVAVHKRLDAALTGPAGGPAAKVGVGPEAVPVADHRVAAITRSTTHDEVASLVGHHVDATGEVAAGVGPAMANLHILVGAAASLHGDPAAVDVTTHHGDFTTVVARRVVTAMANLTVGPQPGSLQPVVEGDGPVGMHADVPKMGPHRSAAALTNLGVGIGARPSIEQNVAGNTHVDLAIGETRTVVAGDSHSPMTNLGEGVEARSRKQRQIPGRRHQRNRPVTIATSKTATMTNLRKGMIPSAAQGDRSAKKQINRPTLHASGVVAPVANLRKGTALIAGEQAEAGVRRVDVDISGDRVSGGIPAVTDLGKIGVRNHRRVRTGNGDLGTQRIDGDVAGFRT